MLGARSEGIANRDLTVLVVDDESPIRQMLARWVTSAGYRCLKADCAAAAWSCLERDQIEIVTTDLAMPGGSGLDLLRRIKTAHPTTAVIVLTASGDSGTAIEALTSGANCYLIKPVDGKELLLQVQRAAQWRQSIIDKLRYTESLEQKVRQQTEEVRRAHEETIHRLASAAMCRDEETGAHIVRTGLLSELLARAAGWSATDADRIRLAAPMHDIGKIGIPDEILRKPGRLTESEFEVMKQHTTIGAAMLAGSSSPVLRLAHDIALFHHERWNGKGYPAGVATESIPEAARILTIVDFYDALTHDRVYRPAVAEPEVLKMMQSEQGRHFDPALLPIFFSILEEVQEVAGQNPDESLKGNFAWFQAPTSRSGQLQTVLPQATSK